MIIEEKNQKKWNIFRYP